jgi:hypothetical protein
MSIVQNLKLLNKPISELAMLPQETIMTMAQAGQIPVAFVAPILAEKAEQAKAGANAAAIAQQQQMPTATVLETLMAQNAANEAREEMPPESGIAALPVSEEMVPNEFAGGGIVAFAAGDLVEAPRTINPTFEEIIAQAERGEGPYVSRPKDINRLPRGLTKEDAYPFQPVEEEVEVVEAAPQGANLRNIDMQSIIQQAEGIASALKPAGTTKVPSIQEAAGQTDELLAASGYDPNVFKNLQKDVQEQRESLKGDRKESINMRLIEAGLAIMGGSSPYAFENIGKGATGAVKGLSEDFKDLRKSERDLRLAEQNLALKQNENAMGKARVTQSTIDKAQDRVDRETDNYNKTKADMAKTLMAGEIQERLARASYSTKMTDFDKQWALYSKDAKARGEPATLDGFRRALEGTRSVVTEKEATRMAVDSLKNSGLDLSTPEGRQEFERQKRFFMQQGGGTKASSAGPTPALPAGFVLQP